ncbi:MAG TPA: hypothetical protein VGI39_03080, partial [Polyangiaceae bacterium]
MNPRRLSRLPLPLLALFALAVLTRISPAFARAAEPPRPITNAPSTDHAPAARRALETGVGGLRPILALTTEKGARGPLELEGRDGVYVGEITLANVGNELLTVSRVAIRGDDEDVRAPSHLSAHLTDNTSGTVAIPPGAEKRVVVTWTPDRQARVHQVFAHVVVTSNDEEAGEVAMGVHAEHAGPLSFLTAHLVSLITFLPLAGALAIVLMQIFGRGSDRGARGIALGITAAQCVLALGI